MDDAKPPVSAPAALAMALDGYAQWLEYHTGTKTDGVEADGSGARLLRAVTEIRRHHCPGANQLMTDLLLGHTKLTAMMFDQQARRERGEPTEPLMMSIDFVSLVEMQRGTIHAMRTACVNERGLCIHSVSSVKVKPLPFARTASLGELKHAQG